MSDKIDFHQDYKDWKSTLTFYQKEVDFFFKELNQVFDKDKENLARMEFIDEYEAILDKNAALIEDLLEQISQREKELITDKDNHKIAENHQELRVSMQSFEAAFTKMKERFKRFASHND